MYVCNNVSKGADGLVGGRVEDLTRAGDPSKGWLHGDESAAVGWIVDRAASVRAKGAQARVGFD